MQTENISLTRRAVGKLDKVLVLCSLIFLSSLYALPDAMANVRSISGVTEVNNATENYQFFTVTCSARKAKIRIIRPANSNRWCDSIVTEMCARDKVGIARQVCSLSYKTALREKNEKAEKQELENVTQEETLKIQSLKEEKLEIAQRLLDIQAKKLDLSRRELDLLKRQEKLKSTN